MVKSVTLLQLLQKIRFYVFHHIYYTLSGVEISILPSHACWEDTFLVPKLLVIKCKNKWKVAERMSGKKLLQSLPMSVT